MIVQRSQKTLEVNDPERIMKRNNQMAADTQVAPSSEASKATELNTLTSAKKEIETTGVPDSMLMLASKDFMRVMVPKSSENGMVERTSKTFA